MAIDILDMVQKAADFEIGDMTPFAALERVIGERWSVLPPESLQAANDPDTIYPFGLDRNPTVWELFELVRKNIVKLSGHFLCTDFAIYAQRFDWRNQPLYWDVPMLLQSGIENVENFLIAPSPGSVPAIMERQLYASWLIAAARVLSLFRKIKAPTFCDGYVSASAWWDSVEPAECIPFAPGFNPQHYYHYYPHVIINGVEEFESNRSLADIFDNMAGAQIEDGGWIPSWHDITIFTSASVSPHMFEEQPPYGPKVYHPGAFVYAERSISGMPTRIRMVNPSGYLAAPHIMFARISNCSTWNIGPGRAPKVIVQRTGAGRERVESLITDELENGELLRIENGTGQTDQREWDTVLSSRQHIEDGPINEKEYEIPASGNPMPNSGTRLVSDNTYTRSDGSVYLNRRFLIPYATEIEYSGVADTFGMSRDFNVIDGPTSSSESSASSGSDDDEESKLAPYSYHVFTFLNILYQEQGDQSISIEARADFDPIAWLDKCRSISRGSNDVVPSSGTVGTAVDPDIGVRGAGMSTSSCGSRLVPTLDFGPVYKTSDDEAIEDWAGIRKDEEEESE